MSCNLLIDKTFGIKLCEVIPIAKALFLHEAWKQGFHNDELDVIYENKIKAST